MFKKFNLPFCVVVHALILLILCPLETVYSSQEFYPFLAEVTADNVHVRSGQSENFESLFKVNLKDELIVVDKSYSWYKIELPSQSKSYVSKEFVLVAQDSKGIITANRLNVRSGPGPRYTVLAQLQEGEDVDILGEKDGWFQIKPIKNSFGWVRDDFISFKSKDVVAFRKKNSPVIFKVSKAPVKKKEAPKVVKVVPVPKAQPVKVVAPKKVIVKKEPKKAPVSDLRKKIDAAMKAQDASQKKTKVIVKKKTKAELKEEIKQRKQQEKLAKKKAKEAKKLKEAKEAQKLKEAKKAEKLKQAKETAKAKKAKKKAKKVKEVKKVVVKKPVPKKIVEKKPEVDKTLVVWEEFKKLKKTKKNDLQYVTVKGSIQPQKEIDSKDIKYKFLINNKPVFYIQGFKHILEEFINFQVQLEGSVVTETQIKQTYPIVEIHKIQLVL